ncbi:MAG: Minf_1886 family protein [Thermoguttaceae bacterium]
MLIDPNDPFFQLLREDRRYKADAYLLVWEALNFAQQVLKMGKESPSEPLQAGPEEDPEAHEPHRHVTGQELCEAIRQYALRQYGFMAKKVLNSWGLYTTGDFGEIVYNLIRIGRMRKTKDDRREDFDNVYDFETAFVEQFKFSPME